MFPLLLFIFSITLLTYTQPLFLSTILHISFFLYHSTPFHSNSFPPSPFTSPGTQAQQAFRSQPRNLTVRMGATAVLRCEVLRASGTVQWVKDGLLLGPQRGLPGFPHYSMIGNPERGKQDTHGIKYKANCDLMDLSKLNNWTSLITGPLKRCHNSSKAIMTSKLLIVVWSL